jgi:Holliday junction resolvasome RuvABC endonuclease subunit
MQDLEEIKKELDSKAVIIEDVNVLFLDISSSCTGYSIANCNFSKKIANFTDSGCIWLDSNWSHQEKYSYMFNAVLVYFEVIKRIDYIIVEQYSVNPKKMMGINVVSEMQGAIKTAAWENGVKVGSILPQTWRSVLKIKKNSEGDFKEPTKNKVLEYVSIPEKVISNITKGERNTPSDVYDALAIGIAWLIKYNFKHLSFKDLEINSHIGALDIK